MNLFLNTSVLLDASGSATGASRELFHRAPQHSWRLLASPYVLNEVVHNLGHLPPDAPGEWDRLKPQLTIVEDILTLNRPTFFGVSKDRPILFQRARMGRRLAHLGPQRFWRPP